jgi:alpha-glucosidase (family GH31 glycosyl hydrolase)
VAKIGPSFLVGLAYQPGVTERKMYLPRDTWIDDYDYARAHASQQQITAAPLIERLPVFIRADRIVPEKLIHGGNMNNWIKQFDQQRALRISADRGR